MRIIKKTTSFDFLSVRRRRIALAISALFVIASLVSLATRGLEFGIDFTGGILLEVGYPQAANLDEIRSNLGAAGFSDAQVQRFGRDTDVLVRLPPQPGTEADEVRAELRQILQSSGESVELRRVEFVSAQVGSELAERGALALVIALLMIFMYVMIRFQWKFAVGSVAALVHDVLITIGLFSIFQLPFDLSVLAAILAVIGYSLNDTIVVFDRIRENFRMIQREGAEAIMNISINQMLGRTMITSATTLFVLLALFLLGGEAVSGFSMALIIGILVGTYSSVYTASASALALDVTSHDLMPQKVDKEAVDDLP